MAVPLKNTQGGGSPFPDKIWGWGGGSSEKKIWGRGGQRHLTNLGGGGQIQFELGGLS